VKSFLQCNISKCPAQTKSNCYKALVKPILEYASTVWSLHPQRDIDAIENIQRWAARFVHNKYSRYASVTQMLSNLHWPTLSRSKNEQKATMLFKIVNHQINIDIDHLLIPYPDIHHTRGHNKRFIIPTTQLNYYTNTLSIYN